MPRELLFTARREIGFQEYQERDPAPNEILVETVLSGISHGTEMNIYIIDRHPEDTIEVVLDFRAE